MSSVKNPTRRAFLRTAGGSAVLSMAQLAAPAVFASAATWRKAPDYDVDLTLGLLLDFSPSVMVEENGINEVSLQINGTAEAFENPNVITAIKEQSRGIAVNLVHFAGNQREVLPWRRITNEKECRAFAKDIRDAGVARGPLGKGTHIAGALRYMNNSVANNPMRAFRKVVDISGDGADNSGGGTYVASAMSLYAPSATINAFTDISSIFALKAAVADLAQNGVTVNGIPICNETPHLDEYYESNVVTPSQTYTTKDDRGRDVPVAGGFVMRANGHEDYAAMLVKKLVLEIG